MVFPRHKINAFTLVEAIVSMGIGGLVVLTVCSLSFQFSRSSSALVNYMIINSSDRKSLETIGRDIREADAFVKLTTGDIVLLQSNQPVQLLFKPLERRLHRITGQANQVLLPNCDALQFTFYERNLSGTDCDDLLVTTSTACRVIEMKWSSTVVSNSSTVSKVTNSVRFLNRRMSAN